MLKHNLLSVCIRFILSRWQINSATTLHQSMRGRGWPWSVQVTCWHGYCRSLYIPVLFGSKFLWQEKKVLLKWQETLRSPLKKLFLFYFLNTHFEAKRSRIRRESADLNTSQILIHRFARSDMFNKLYERHCAVNKYIRLVPELICFSKTTPWAIKIRFAQI